MKSPSTQLNIHAVESVTIQYRRLAQPGEPGWPKGLIALHIVIDSTDGPIKIVAFAPDSSLPVTFSEEPDDE